MTDAIDPRVSHRYDLHKKLGQGSYGVVWKAFNKRTRAVVALKKCFGAFRCDTDAQRTYREIMYLQALAGHENIVMIQTVIRAENDSDLYIAFDCMEIDLQKIIQSKYDILDDNHRKYIIYQILRALKYIHSAKLIHRDLKPANILVDSNCQVKICDFGLCRSIANDDAIDTSSPLVLTDYVATRWYRSPEILTGSTKYTEGLDLWSVGCILGEMYRGRPILPGSSSLNQLEKIFEVTGNPTALDVASWQNIFAPDVVRNVKARCRVELSELCPDIPKDAKQLIASLFTLNPDKRGSAETALGHKYVRRFHDPEKEPCYPHGPIKIDIQDSVKMTADDYREHIYSNIREKRSEIEQFKIEIKALKKSPNRKSGSLDVYQNNDIRRQRRNPARRHRRVETSDTVGTEFSDDASTSSCCVHKEHNINPPFSVVTK